MMSLATNIDGVYTVSSVSDYQGPIQKRSDGQTEIRNGQTHRIDDAGCEWISTFSETDDDETILMTSIADPLNANPDFMLTRPDGSPTSDKVIYEAKLSVKRKDERIQLSGAINYGSETVFLTLRKISN